ncbi:MAG: rhamnulokinase family protein [Anaerolineae bacterium]
MMQVAAVDLGNESGRVMHINFDGQRIASAEVYRFPNNPVTANGTIFWDVLRLWHEIEIGLTKALEQPLAGIAVDSFGVDFGLLDGGGQLISNPVHMRDGRTAGTMEWVLERIPKATLFERSGGIGFYVINSLYQLVAIAHHAPWQLEAARTFLTMPNLMNYWLTGEKVSEFTHTTTTQCYNPLAGEWDWPTLETLGIPTAMFPPVVQPGVKIGVYNHVPVFAVASHDTGSAVVAVPTATANYAYISSGTWSLFGLETRQPLTSRAAMEANLTSEGGAYGTYRPLKMVMGMWLIQQCRAQWAQQGVNTDYDWLLAQAESESAFRSLIDPDDTVFFPPGDMVGRIRSFCQQSGQVVPESVGQVMRCALESLALKYRFVLEQLLNVSGQAVEVIHIVGGGSQNPVLCQMTADATGRPVLAGPVEATALGNGLVQLIALGEIKDIAEARRVIRASFPPVLYESKSTASWDEAYSRFRRLMTTQ